ncbi:MAG: 23S rRNA (uracil(1939)-C(5))-methyltransferase RlmD [Bacillota bacterium]|nr:23S rRNA (uracil(1939)-C(5))-methyltransferase RlmD [Bacillota bacterium]
MADSRDENRNREDRRKYVRGIEDLNKKNIKKEDRRKKAANGAGLQPGDSATLLIEDINHAGQGIGHVDGLTVFVQEAIPGDRVLVNVTRRHTGYAVADVLQLLQPSPYRIIPDCPQADRCGGCTLQMMQYEEQLRYKQQQVEQALTRIGRIILEPGIMQPIIGMDDPWHYRGKAQFPIAGSVKEPLIGYYASRSHTVIDAPVCRIQYPVVDAIRETLRQHIRRWQVEPYRENDRQGLLRHLIVRIGYATGDIMVILVINGDSIPGQPELIQQLHACVQTHQEPELPLLRLRSVWLNINRATTNVIMGQEDRLIDGQPWIDEIILGIRSRISPQAFFQVNPRQTTRLYQQVLDMAALQGNEQVLDLYCGTGSITLQLARKAGWVLGIESHPAAVADARMNADLNGLANVTFSAGKTEDILPEWQKQGRSIDLVVLDPPRKGCDPAVTAALGDLQTPRLIYVSCNPATLARDLSQLQSYGYNVQRVQPVDLFPWTGHVETVVEIEKV